MPNPLAIITGAGRGIGRAAAVQLAARGYDLLLVSRTLEQLNETVRLAGRGDALVADVAKPADVQRVVQHASRVFGRIDAIVHCAGLAPSLSVDDTSPQQWRDVLDTNLSSASYLAHYAWPTFRSQHSGVIVNLSSFSSSRHER